MSKKLCAKDIGAKLNINWKKYDIKQFEKGLKVELEHGKKHPKTDVTNDDPVKTGKIVLAHLNEKSNYYDLLEKVESKRLKK